MNSKRETEEREVELATFSERVLAFSLDLAIFAAGYELSFKLAFPDFPAILHPAMTAWLPAWGGLFLAYQAALASDGRATIGKRLLGLRVATLEGRPLSLGQSVMRAAIYPLSSILGLGFLWSLFNTPRQCWHDLALGSVVLRDRTSPVLPLAALRAGALACLVVIGAGYGWRSVWGPRYHRILTVAYAHVGMSEVADLQKQYRKKNGRYATNLFALANISPDHVTFMRDMARVFDIENGFKIDASKTSYTILTRARDDQRTPIKYVGS